MANRRTPAAVASEAVREIIDQKLAELRRMPPGDIVGVEIKMTVLQALSTSKPVGDGPGLANCFSASCTDLHVHCPADAIAYGAPRTRSTNLLLKPTYPNRRPISCPSLIT